MGALFIGKTGSHILLYCETLLQVLPGVYIYIYIYTVKKKDFIGYLFCTILLLFYMFEIGKAKSATQIVFPAVVNKVETWLNMFVSMSTIVLYDG